MNHLINNKKGMTFILWQTMFLAAEMANHVFSSRNLVRLQLKNKKEGKFVVENITLALQGGHK